MRYVEAGSRMAQPEWKRRIRCWRVAGGLVLVILGLLVGEHFAQSWMWLAGLWIGWAVGSGAGWLATRN